ncbi:MAG: hypothetical protein ACR2IQ_02560 [Minisyncoccia bacterium]
MNTSQNKSPSNEIGSYQSPVLAKEYGEINKAFVVSELPTNANSTKQAAPTLSASQDSPAKVGNLSC